MFAASLLMTGCGGNGGGVESEHSGGEAAKPFSLPDDDGDQVSLEELRGKVVLVSFWATWCGPCRIEIPELARMKKRLGGDFEVLLISMEASSVTRKMLDKWGIDLTSLRDEGGAVSRDYGVRGIPNAFLIDKKGIVKAHHVGYSRSQTEKLEKEAASLLES